MTPAERAFKALGYEPFGFQRQAWQAIVSGRSGLLQAGTGTGKTYAIWGGLLNRILGQSARQTGRLSRPSASAVASPVAASPGLQVLWVTPMRALAADTAQSLQRLSDASGYGLRVGLRTGDTATAERARQERSPPHALVTTPESLCLLLSKPQGLTLLQSVHAVVADEWHELLGSKRGVQLQLALASLASLRRSSLGSAHPSPQPPSLIVWGLSATLGNLDEASECLCASVLSEQGLPVCQIACDVAKPVVIETLLPAQAGRFPWAGHLGLAMRDQVVETIDKASTSLVFTNTRSQAELWYQALLEARPDWAGCIALHHGSLDHQTRGWVEKAIAQGLLKAVVATSSLDLGVDFAPVEQVLQIGSPKGLARLLQRAGRSGHQPGKTARLVLVPTHALEILESYAAQRALATGRIESRPPPQAPMDVLVQHLATRVLGRPMNGADLYQEVRTAYSYRSITPEAFAWALQFLSQGGTSLAAYPEFHRLQTDAAGRWQMADARLARRHRLSIGTILSDASIRLAWVSGGSLGQIEESFIGRLKPGDTFLFSGRALELVRVKDLTAYVRLAKKKAGAVPRWNGGNMPLSGMLAATLREVLSELAPIVAATPVARPATLPATIPTGVSTSTPVTAQALAPELAALWPLLITQALRSRLPPADSFLLERLDSREGAHVFVYPFAGRTVHLGLATLLAYRLSQQAPVSLSYSVNDYGLELLVPRDQAGLLTEPCLRSLILTGNDRLAQDLLSALSAGGLAQRRFREIARVAGLVFSGMPGAEKTSRQFAASSNLFYEVFQKYDPDNALLQQSWREVQRDELNQQDLSETLNRCSRAQWLWVDLSRPSPFSFPLMVERLREQLSSEKLADRVARMLEEAHHGLPSGQPPGQSPGPLSGRSAGPPHGLSAGLPS
ncbi:MAG: ligase-associated DNA damage response DEXH box helicase [Burkholderiaceae bacterium]